MEEISFVDINQINIWQYTTEFIYVIETVPK